MSFVKDFKNFILTGNLIELAVAVILASAVSLVVTSFTQDIVMPVIGHFVGGVDFSELKYILSPQIGVEGDANYQAENAIRYGQWINTVINLVLVGFVLFLITKAYVNFAKKKKQEEAAAVPAGPTQEELLVQIRDLLSTKTIK